MIIGHDGNAPPGDRQFHELADDAFIAVIRSVHRHGHIGQHGFRAGGGDDNVIAAIVQRHAVGQRIAEVPEMPGNFARFHFQIADRGFQLGVPVDQPLVAVEQAFVVQINEHLHHRAGEMRVHGELFPAPVHRTAQTAQLPGDGAAAFGLPFPHLVDELLARVVGALVLCGFQLAFDHHLRGNPGMIGADHPQRILAAQAFIAHDNILQRVVERVADVQAARYIGRRVDDGEGLGVWPLWPEQAVGFPMGIPLRLDGGGVECLVQLRLVVRLGHGPALCQRTGRGASIRRPPATTPCPPAHFTA